MMKMKIMHGCIGWKMLVVLVAEQWDLSYIFDLRRSSSSRKPQCNPGYRIKHNAYQVIYSHQMNIC